LKTGLCPNLKCYLIKVHKNHIFFLNVKFTTNKGYAFEKKAGFLSEGKTNLLEIKRNFLLKDQIYYGAFLKQIYFYKKEKEKK